mgnify:FL=1
MASGSLTSAAAADLCRNFGLWQDRAMHEPVIVTNHGRPRTVLISTDAYSQLKAGIEVRPASAAGGLTQLLHQLSQGFVALDGELTVKLANRAAELYFQRSADALAGARLIDLYPALTESVMSRIFSRIVRTGEPASFEAPSDLYEGQTIRVDAFPYDGGVGYLFARIDDDLQTRTQIAEGEAVQAMMAAHGQAGTARLTMRGPFSQVSDALLAMLGFDAQHLAHARLTDLVPIGRRVAVGEGIETVLSGGSAVALDSEFMTRKGAEIPVTIALAATRNAFSIDGLALLVTPRRAAGEA